MTNYVLSRAEKAEIARRAVAGERPVDLAREFGVTRQSIHGVLRVRAVPVRADPCGDGESEWVTLVQAARLLGIKRTSLGESSPEDEPGSLIICCPEPGAGVEVLLDAATAAWPLDDTAARAATTLLACGLPRPVTRSKPVPAR